ncbi:hypothetical protein F511_24493 [Dorcoceras hygrometricum]|uniref:Splicing factor 3B subunit 1-like n=1 Tax=Dorcoceras hygrometricum TaxID=472368 RepID=A0A2Z7BT63_9LAMI|nr:hypothetical protein F511_24493 [Dorcoceras hygrometricum]
MASSLIVNALQVNFDSVLTFLEEGMVKMFKALESTGLRGFLGCPSVLYEQDLEQFFSVAFLKENEVISAVQGKFIGISEEIFVGAFGLPIAGLTDMSEVPKDLFYDARSIFSASGEPVKTSCKKREMKFEFRDGDQVIKESQGLCSSDFVLLNDAPNLTLGEARTFPPLKIITVKTVGTYIVKNKNITADEDEPVEKMVKKTATKRRPAPAVLEPATKKKRTTARRDTPAEKDLALVTVVQDVEPISVVPAVTPRAQRHRAPKRKLVLRDESDDEIVDNIIKQVLTEIAEVEDVETDLEEPVVETTEIETVETESRIDVSSITNYDEDSSLKVLSNEEGPLISVADKGKAPLVEKDEIKGHPAREMFSLICADIEFLVQIREKVIEDISSFFSSFSLRRLAILESVSDIAAKEEQILAWAETDSLQTAARPLQLFDLQVLEMISEAHHLALSTLMEQMRQHKLKWIRPSASNLFEGATVQRGAVIARSHPTIKSTCWIRQLILLDGSWTILEGSDKWLLLDPLWIEVQFKGELLIKFSTVYKLKVFVISLFNKQIRVLFSDSSSESIESIRVISPAVIPNFSNSSSTSSHSASLNSSRSSSSSDSRMLFTVDDLPEIPSSNDILQIEETPDAQISLPTVGVPSTAYTEAVAQRRATVDQISIEHVQTRFHLDELKAELFKKISSLETAFLTAFDNQDRVVLAQTNVVRIEKFES